MNLISSTYSSLRALAPEMTTVAMVGVLALLGYIVLQLVNAFIDLRDRSYLKEDSPSILEVLSKTPSADLKQFQASNLCLTVFDDEKVVVSSCNKEDEDRIITSNQKAFIASLKELGVDNETVQTKRYGSGPGGKLMTLISTALVRDGKLYLLEA